MKTLITVLIICSSYTIGSSAFAGGRNSSISANPALPVPILKPANPDNPALPIEAEPNPARPPAANSLDPVYPPLPVRPAPIIVVPEPRKTCEITVKQASLGAWQGYVDWGCDNRILHPIKWFFFARNKKACCSEREALAPVSNWQITFDGPYVIMNDNRVGGAVFQGAYNGYNVLQGQVYYAGAMGCWQITRITPPPTCDGRPGAPLPMMPMQPVPPPEFLPVLVR